MIRLNSENIIIIIIIMKVLQPNCKTQSMERDSLNQQHVTQRHTSTLCFCRVVVGKITVTVGKLLMKFIAILVNVAIGLAMFARSVGLVKKVILMHITRSTSGVCSIQWYSIYHCLTLGPQSAVTLKGMVKILRLINWVACGAVREYPPRFMS